MKTIYHMCIYYVFMMNQYIIICLNMILKYIFYFVVNMCFE